MPPAAARALLLALALTLVPGPGVSAASAECSALTENTLTSDGCPSNCYSSPCVLYSPAQDDTCADWGASGPCYADDNFTVPGASAACNMTYQCLDSLVTTTNFWILALDANTQADTYTLAPVTEIVSITYPSTTLAVELTGGTSLTLKSEMKNVLLDASFFDTPSATTSMFLMNVNLRNILPSAAFSANWYTVYLTNTNLDAVPDQFANLTTTKVDLSYNYISAFPADGTAVATAFADSLTLLNLADNLLTDFNTTLPKLTELNLTNNDLTGIPAMVFTLASDYALKNVYLRGNNLTNLELTTDQVTIIEQLTTFEADVAITGCADGFAATAIRDGSLQVCAASTATAGSDDGGSSHSTLYIIIGVVAGVAVVLAIIALVLYRRHRNNRNLDVYKTAGDGTTDIGTDIGSDDTLGSSSIWNDPDLLAVRVDHREVEAIKLLSRGGFGEVWLGLYMNENVAIKRLLSDKRTVQDALVFATEIKTMARMDHPKIVRFIGVSWTNALSIQAITEFMDCGDLKSLLDSPRSSTLTWANLKCQIAIDIADALVYMHTLNPKLIHRDLKSRNVLIDAQAGAKLSDFGISRNRSYTETMTAGVGTARWIAPEVILGGHYTEFADIYSFGVVLSEIDTCKPPYHDAVNTNGGKMQDVTILQLVSAGKLTPSLSPECPPSIVQLTQACLAFDPAQRPSAIHISYELRKIMKDEL